jgi:hypothetical protein
LIIPHSLCTFRDTPGHLPEWLMFLGYCRLGFALRRSNESFADTFYFCDFTGIHVFV